MATSDTLNISFTYERPRRRRQLTQELEQTNQELEQVESADRDQGEEQDLTITLTRASTTIAEQSATDRSTAIFSHDVSVENHRATDRAITPSTLSYEDRQSPEAPTSSAKTDNDAPDDIDAKEIDSQDPGVRHTGATHSETPVTLGRVRLLRMSEHGERTLVFLEPSSFVGVKVLEYHGKDRGFETLKLRSTQQEGEWFCTHALYSANTSRSFERRILRFSSNNKHSDTASTCAQCAWRQHPPAQVATTSPSHSVHSGEAQVCLYTRTV